MIPLRIDFLNSNKLNPGAPNQVTIDVDQGSIDSGVLQLTDGTFLVLDETSMSSGQLTHQGIKNLASLQQLLMHQTLYYELHEPMPFDKNLNVLVLSEGDAAVTATSKFEFLHTD
jgi:hypothetical protein